MTIDQAKAILERPRFDMTEIEEMAEGMGFHWDGWLPSICKFYRVEGAD